MLEQKGWQQGRFGCVAPAISSLGQSLLRSCPTTLEMERVGQLPLKSFSAGKTLESRRCSLAQGFAATCCEWRWHVRWHVWRRHGDLMGRACVLSVFGGTSGITPDSAASSLCGTSGTWMMRKWCSAAQSVAVGGSSGSLRARQGEGGPDRHSLLLCAPRRPGALSEGVDLRAPLRRRLLRRSYHERCLGALDGRAPGRPRGLPRVAAWRRLPLRHHHQVAPPGWRAPQCFTEARLRGGRVLLRKQTGLSFLLANSLAGVRGWHEGPSCGHSHSPCGAPAHRHVFAVSCCRGLRARARVAHSQRCLESLPQFCFPPSRQASLCRLGRRFLRARGPPAPTVAIGRPLCGAALQRHPSVSPPYSHGWTSPASCAIPSR